MKSKRNMWLEECDGFAELCRGYLPYYLLIILPIFIIISPVNPIAASHEFPVYRMHQYDLHGVPHGKKIVFFYFHFIMILLINLYNFHNYIQVVVMLLFLWKQDLLQDGAHLGIV